MSILSYLPWQRSLFGCLAMLAYLSLTAQVPVLQAEPFHYVSKVDGLYKSYSKSSQFVEMADGVKLAVDVFLPTKGPEAKSFPTVFVLTPYGRSQIMPKMGLPLKVAASVVGLGSGPVFDPPDYYLPAEEIIRHGYAYVVADMRGTGASFGTQLPMMPDIGVDGKALIDWMAEQSWCDGNVGMMGPSYLGWSQLVTANQKPEALKCIMPEVIGAETFTGGNRPGGIAAQRWLRGYSARLRRVNLNMYDLSKRNVPAAPVIDEDGDGKLKDEWHGLDSLQLARRDLPHYGDKEEREHDYFYQATLEHLDNVLVTDFLAEGMEYFDSHAPAPYQDQTYESTVPAAHLTGIAGSGIPIYHLGGWFDGFARGTPKLYATLAPTNPSRLMMGPRFHSPTMSRAYRKFFGEKEKYIKLQTLEHLRFFDRYLKGIQNGIDEEPPVLLYVMNRGWRFESEWPLKREVRTRFFFGAYGALQDQPETDDVVDKYPVDFALSSNYGKEDLNRWIMYKPGPGVVMDRTALDPRCLSYDTEILFSDVEVTGHPIVRIWLSADQADADVFVYLSDVDEKGRSLYVTEGQLRAGWHELHEDDDQAMGTIDIQPELPWHGYKAGQYDENPLADGKIISLEFDLLPTSWVFKKGHKIRIAIAGADAGNFQYNPTLCPDNSLKSCADTQLQIHRGKLYGSFIELPIIPAEHSPAPKELSSR